MTASQPGHSSNAAASTGQAAPSVPEALDFQADSAALADLLSDLTETELTTSTGFKQWSINDIIAHLHFFNELADQSLRDEPRFVERYAQLRARMQAGATMMAATNDMLEGLTGRALIAAWQAQVDAMTPPWSMADPRARVQWAGPTMSVRSSISARLMETWAHAQAIYDLRGLHRTNTDRLRSIVVMGVNTFGWTFTTRSLPVPAEKPAVLLRAPSGAAWHFNEAAAASNCIEGSAEAFCQVVTQVRNVQDTDLRVSGPIATAWMQTAQCFAGGPKDPPAPGQRRIAAQRWPERTK